MEQRETPQTHFEKRPYIDIVPSTYEADKQLIDAANKGETITELTTFEGYFQRIAEQDPVYMAHLETLLTQKQERFPESSKGMHDRRLQMVVPAYREGENMEQFLNNIKSQFEDSDHTDWGVTFVIDYSLPYRKPEEFGGFKEMRDAIHRFIKENPQYSSRLDYIYYTRQKGLEVLPVGLARKIGEDVLMLEKFKLEKQNNASEGKPLYLGLMDMDTGHLSEGLLDEMRSSLPEQEDEDPVVVRVQGSFDSPDVKEHLYLHPLQMMWEGVTSEVGKNSKHNPFNIGRLSAVPARELAMTGGGFAKVLQFPDEDIRHGLQIEWQLHNVSTVEVDGKYSTSARREVKTVEGLLQLLEDNGGVFNKQALRCGALIDMYGSWKDNSFRRAFGNVNDVNGDNKNPLENPEYFNKAVPPHLLETVVNAFYRFTASSMFAIDTLSESDKTPEIQQFKKDFLAGKRPYFDVQLSTLAFLKELHDTDPDRFAEVKPLLEQADAKAKQAVSSVLDRNSVNYELDETPLYGIIEGTGSLKDGALKDDSTPLEKRFKISNDQTRYMQNIKAAVQ